MYQKKFVLGNYFLWRNGEEEGQMAQLPSTHRPNLLDQLSPREREILPLVAQGKDNREIGRILFISEKTAKNYVTSIRKKLGLKNRTQIALFALKEGIINLDDTLVN
ncbi:MAG: response regulator transcription factor [Firmicutes bacterium]|nr:response regulator transcription factor [Bacillota bacterium]